MALSELLQHKVPCKIQACKIQIILHAMGFFYSL